MKNILHISHRSDVDGLTPIILSKLAFPNVEYLLLEPDEVNSILKEMIEHHIFSNYDFVFMTDLCPTKEIANQLQDENIQNFFVIDHHFGKMNMNTYPFIAVIDTDESFKKQSATSLYYQYLEKSFSNSDLKRQSVKDLVELVRCVDTWDFTEQNKRNASWLANILSIFGHDAYIENYHDRLLREKRFQFTEQEKFLLMVEDNRIRKYIEDKENQMISVEINGYQAGVVFAESYHSVLGNTLAKKYEDSYDFIAIIDVSKGISYRSVNDIDVSKISRIYGGNGHYHASGSPIPKHILNCIINQCFPKRKISHTIIRKKKGGIHDESK